MRDGRKRFSQKFINDLSLSAEFGLSSLIVMISVMSHSFFLTLQTFNSSLFIFNNFLSNCVSENVSLKYFFSSQFVTYRKKWLPQQLRKLSHSKADKLPVEKVALKKGSDKKSKVLKLENLAWS